MSILVASLAIIAIAAVATIMANSNLRTRLVGNSPLGNAAIPLFAAGLVWLANSGASVLTTSISDSTAPQSNIIVFIEDIQFGLPIIPEDYSKRSLTHAEISALLEPFRNSSDTIRLTESEVATLSRIAYDSFQASGRPVSSDRSYSMSDVSDVFFPSFALYYEYHSWGTIAKQWSEFLDNNRDREVASVMQKFAQEQVFFLPNTPMFLDALVGMIALDQINISYTHEDCQATPTSSGIRFRDKGDNFEIDWGSFGSQISRDSEASRVEAAKTVGFLLSHGCISVLIDVFSKMEEVFVREAKLMQSFLDEWEAVLRNRKSKTIEISVTISKGIISDSARIGVDGSGTI